MTARCALPRDAGESAALWSLVALAHRDLGEDAEARAAMEAALTVAPADERSGYEGQLVTLAATTASDRLSEAERLTNAQAEAKLALVREAVAWLESALVVTPGDEDLEEQASGARALLWSAFERAALTLVHRQEFRGARRLLREAVANAHFPAARTDVFRELFTGTFSGEIGQLTARAIRSMHAARESDALAALQRAETLLDNLGDDMLSPSRREEVDGRLWWGYNRLGERRVAAGEYEIALDPLFHALEDDAGPARHEETRALLVRALEGVADVRALAIRELAAAGRSRRGRPAVQHALDARSAPRPNPASAVTSSPAPSPALSDSSRASSARATELRRRGERGAPEEGALGPRGGRSPRIRLGWAPSGWGARGHT